MLFVQSGKYLLCVNDQDSGTATKTPLAPTHRSIELWSDYEVILLSTKLTNFVFRTPLSVAVFLLLVQTFKDTHSRQNKQSNDPLALLAQARRLASKQ